MIRRRPRAFATFLVLWAVALAAVVLTTLQSVSHQQSAAGRLAVGRVRAYWAARAGVEAQIAALTAETLAPVTNSAFTVHDDLAAAARGVLQQASFRVAHTYAGVERDGALDAHSLLNINSITTDSMLLLPDMDELAADAITDWIDEDDEPEESGAEEGQYASDKFPYKPRNAPFRSIRELELVIGMTPEIVRGEDWNLNGLLDPNENDGDLSWPPDNADGKLDAGWSQHLTAVSDHGLGPGYGPSGLSRLELSTATSSDIARRLSIDTSQADAIVNYVSQGGTMVDFIESELSSLASLGATQLDGQRAPSVPDLSTEQLSTLLEETYIEADRVGPRSGKVNINTVDQTTLEYLAEVSAGLADAIINERNARSGGFVHLVDLLEVPAIDRETLAQLYPYLDVRSEIFVATSRGRDEPSGLEVEIQAVLDRSTVPVVIRDLTIR